MKTSVRAIAILTMLFAGHATAELMYYTFEGTISDIDSGSHDDVVSTREAEFAQFSIGDPVSYTFGIDLERIGEQTVYNDPGEPDMIWENPDFYTDLVSGNYLMDGGDPSLHTAWNIKEYNFGTYPGYTGRSMFWGESEDDKVWIWSADPVAPISEWDVGLGLGFIGQEFAHDVTGLEGYIQFDLTLVSIVPVPSAVILGILGLSTAGWRLRKKKEA